MKLNKITFAGHSATFIDCDNLRLAIDPWLENNPACPANLKRPDKLDLILLTHGHSDHAGEAASLAKRCGAAVAATFELAMLMSSVEEVPQQNLIPMNKGGCVQFKGLTIALTNAFHSSSYDTPSGAVYAGEPCGVVVSDGEFTVYHAGDTCLFSDMSLIGEIYHPDLALLPIGDRFTMGPREAARAAKILGCKTVIPVHYGTFDMLTGTAEQFMEHCAPFGIEVIALKPGQSHTIR